MAHYSPCFVCPMNPCERKLSTQKQLRGAPITSARIRCPEYDTLFKKGQRVSVRLNYCGDFEGYERSSVDGVMGTVIGRSKHKWSVYIDKSEQDFLELTSKHGVVRLTPDRMTAEDDGADPVEKLMDLVRYDFRGGDMPTDDVIRDIAKRWCE